MEEEDGAVERREDTSGGESGQGESELRAAGEKI